MNPPNPESRDRTAEIQDRIAITAVAVEICDKIKKWPHEKQLRLLATVKTILECE